jgi:hypothetical protein
MTSPGGGEIIVNPDDNYRHVATRRNQAVDFFADKPPDVPDDPDGNDPTKQSTRDLTGAVQDTSHGFGHHSNGVADGVENATNNYVNRDLNNAGLLAGVAGGGSPQKEAAKGLTDVGVGSIMNSVLTPSGAITGAFEQALGGFTQAFAGFGQAGGNIAGQSMGAGINASATMAKATLDAGAKDAAGGAGGTGGAGGSGEGRGGHASAPPTHLASGTTPLTSPQSAVPASYSAHTPIPDRSDPVVRPASAALGGMPLGLPGDGGRQGSAAKPITYRVATGSDAHHPTDEPIPGVDDPEIAAAPASAFVPLQKSI